MEPQKLTSELLATSISPVATAKQPISPWVEKFNWKFEAYHRALEQVLPTLKQFCSDVLSGAVEPYWLTILGPSGVGKTFGLKQAFWMLSKNEHLWEIETATGSQLPQCAHIVPSEDLTDYKAPRDYGKYDLLYVEDIGAGAGMDKGSGAVTTSRIAELLQFRAQKWTLLDANLTRAEVETKIDPRIASRLKRDGSVLIQLPSDIPDYSDRFPR